MNGYNFRLQKLLDIRKNKEELSIIEFKDAQLKKKNTEEKLMLLKEDYERVRNFEVTCSAISQKIKLNYLNAVNNNIDNTNEELKKNMFNLEEKRSDLEKKQIERKTVEILKNKKIETFIKEQNRIEQINNDEFALYGFIRNKNLR